ncbi:MAG: ABC transporter ATP-binding protein [Microbacterium sp.]|uniref:ABC transporter ATP-binding protein n=1 Tax=Microbacterium sp. TaxID=51671 RepID=UPI00262CFE78|nr:ABC transporter ATP-binding protein [Microbacterium sp.]MCX6503007.1 ABC transporter ATP-binding protein [Microbacterium sp.]
MGAGTRIRVQDVGKIYGVGSKQVEALKGVDLDIRDNEFVCMVGPSGCGKSTLLRIIADLQRPSAGEVEVTTSAAALRPSAVVFQDYSIYPWKTVKDNVKFGLLAQNLPKAEVEDRVSRWLDKLSLTAFADHYPSQLSGGMRQRVAIARAMVVESEILLMDEPFAALDAQLRRVLQEELLDLWQDMRRTVLFITHNLDEAILLGDRVVVMSGRPGRVIGDYEVPFGRPRNAEIRGSADFAALEQELWHQLRHEVDDGAAARAEVA